MANETSNQLIIALLRGFEWFDEGLQRSIRARGWPTLTRPESMVMIHVIQDMVRPSEIARSLGLTRQAVHRTIGQICAKGLLDLKDDPNDGRGSIIVLTAQGEAMRKDAQHIVAHIHAELVTRIGKSAVDQLVKALVKDWGPVAGFGPDDRPL